MPSTRTRTSCCAWLRRSGFELGSGMVLNPLFPEHAALACERASLEDDVP